MIKPQDLRIGNWVWVTEIPDKMDGHYTRVAELHADEIRVSRDLVENDYGMGCSPQDVLPIPLSPEILEKSDLKKWEDDTYRMRIDEYIVFHIEPDGRYGFWSSSVDNESNFTLLSQDNRIEYLHQLQNLLYALHGTELKIEL